MTPCTIAHQETLSMEFSRQEYWSELPCPSPGDIPKPRIKPWSPSLQADSLPLSHQDPSATHTYIIYMFNYIHLWYQNQIDYIICSQRWRSSIQSAKTRPGADCGSDHELLIAKFRLKQKKWGKPLDHSGMT